MPKDLRTFLGDLQKNHPGHLMVVDKEVDPKWEITAMVDKMKREGTPKFPGLLFNNVKGSNLPVLINVMGSYDRLAYAFDTNVRNMVSEFGDRLANAIPPVEVSAGDAPVKEVVWTGNDIDLGKLPVVWHNELDSGH